MRVTRHASPAADARRIVDEVLTAHADGPDPALAAAARAELESRRQRQLEQLRANGARMRQAVQDAWDDHLDHTLRAAAFVSGLRLGGPPVPACMNPECDRPGVRALHVFGRHVGFVCDLCDDNLHHHLSPTGTDHDRA